MKPRLAPGLHRLSIRSGSVSRNGLRTLGEGLAATASRSFGHSIATNGLTSARARTSSTVETGTISRPFFTLSGISGKSRSFSLGISTVFEPSPQRREEFLLKTADRQHPPAKADLAGHRDFFPYCRTGQRRHDRGDHRHARGRTVLGCRPLGHMDVDVALLGEATGLMPNRLALERT